MAEELSIKEVLHQTIEKIDDDKILYAAYTLLKNKTNLHINEPSEEYLNILEERDAQYQAGKMKVYTLEELDAEMKRKYGF